LGLVGRGVRYGRIERWLGALTREERGLGRSVSWTLSRLEDNGSVLFVPWWWKCGGDVIRFRRSSEGWLV